MSQVTRNPSDHASCGDENVRGFQDYYPDELSHCYGCGRLNPHGYKIKSFWDGEESVARFQPKPYHTAIPGFVYGGLIASLIDCHGTGTAAGAALRASQGEAGRDPMPRFLTASLKVDYLKPTPLGPELELRATVKEIKERKVITEVRVFAEGVECARGEVVAVRVKEEYLAKLMETKEEALGK